MVCAESVVNENGVPRRPVQFTPSGHIVGMLDRDIRTTKPHYPVINCQFGTDDKEVQKQITMCHSVRRQHTRPIKEFHYRRLSHELVVPGRETKCISRINGPNYVYQSFQSKFYCFNCDKLFISIGGALSNRWPIATWENSPPPDLLSFLNVFNNPELNYY